MKRRLLRATVTAFCMIGASTWAPIVAQEPTAANAASSETTWHFAISGDSRNCGDVVVPTIAAEVKKQGAAFYWHLGDFRYISNIDEDMECGPNHLDGFSGHIKYGLTAWKDFLENQVASFGSLPVFLGIGNHEMVFHKDREDFLSQFAGWLDSPVLRAQRLKDDPEDRSPHSYYHWIDRGIDFISLDNASGDSFGDDQVRWFQRVVARDRADASVKALVVGMHEALPDSIAAGHSMSDSSSGITTGHEVYQALLKAQNQSGKHVYVVASHSHYYADNIYDTETWRTGGGVLPGWIVGTAGAHRYALPDAVQKTRPNARTNVYGYLLATAHLGGVEDGTVDFKFIEILPGQVPEDVGKRFDPGFVSWCFASNRDGDGTAPKCQK